MQELALGPAAIAAELVEVFHLDGLAVEDVLDCLTDWTEGPYRDSDYPAAALPMLRRVTPANAAAIVSAVESFDGEG